MGDPIRIFRIPGAPDASAGLPKIPYYGFRDYFSRPDSNVAVGSTEDGKPWSASGDSVWGLASGEAKLVSSSVQFNTLTADAFTPDITFIGICGSTLTTAPGWVLRSKDVGNNLLLNNGGGKPSLYRRVDGQSTQIATSTIAGANVPNDEMRVVMKGSSIKVYKNGQLCIDVVEDMYKNETKFGLAGYNTQLAHRWTGVKTEV